MNSLIKLAIERPVAVMAVMILTVMFGVVSSQIIPIRMSPDIEKPILQVVSTGQGHRLKMWIERLSPAWKLNYPA